MAISRSSPPTGAFGTTNTGTNNQVGTSLTTGSQTTTGSSRTNQSQTQTTKGTTDYLDPTARAALNSLLSGLSGVGGGNRFNPLGGGGEVGKKKGTTNSAAAGAKERDQIRLNEIATNQGIRADYSKGQAFGDATNAMNAQMSQALKAAMPTITAGIDAAGTSGGALSALLTQQAAEDAAAEAAQLGLQSAIQYGQIQTGLSGVIEGLLGQGSETSDMLLQALGIAKGAYEKTNTTTSSSGSSSTSSSQTTNSSQSTVNTGTSTDTTVPNQPVTKKKTSQETGYGMLGSPTVTAMPGSAAMSGTGKSYSGW